ncbi:MAG: DUF2094 domain-containing protein [Planctomycetes bacterium]|nr:DUF2094 domain-containing protein [Planctomycetota bacterium]
MTAPVDSEPLRAGYGKLPGSREYVRLESDRGAARWFRDFLDRAAVHFALASGEAAPCLRFVAPVPDGNPRAAPLVVASVWPSSDEGGRRSFPFSFFTLLGPSARPARHPGFFGSLATLHDDHDALFGEARALSETTGFDRRFGSASRPVPAPLGDDEATQRFAEGAARVPLAGWFAAVFGSDGGDGIGAGAMVLWRLRNVLLAAHGDLARLAPDCPGMRLPLAHDVDVALQADAWLGLLAGDGARLSCEPNFVLGPMPHDGEPGLAVFFRPLSPHDAALFDGRGIRGLVDLGSAREPAELDGFVAFSDRVRREVAEGSASLARLPRLLDGMMPA